MKLFVVAACLAVAFASEESAGSSSGSSEKKSKRREVDGDMCSHMQLCIDRRVRIAYGRMYDQLTNFHDPTGECTEDVAKLHKKIGEALRCSKAEWRSILSQVHDDMLPEMAHVDELVKCCMKKNYGHDSHEYCSDWRVPKEGKLSFRTGSKKCDKLAGVDFEIAMDVCMKDHSSMRECKPDAPDSPEDDDEVREERLVFRHLRQCLDTKAEDIPLCAAEDDLEGANKERKKREVHVKDFSMTLNEMEADQGQRELVAGVKACASGVLPVDHDEDPEGEEDL